MSMAEADILALVRREVETIIEERGLVFPTSSIDRLPGAKNNAGTAFFIPNTTAGFSIAVSDGEGHWNEYINVGPVS